METEDDLNYGIYGQPAVITRVVDRLGELGIYGTGGNAIDPNDFGSSHNKDISIPETFKDVLLKLCPEIKDVVSIGYRENSVYDPIGTFNPIYKYLVGVDLYFDDHNGMKKSKNEYGKEIGDYFRMTYGSEMDFISFHVQSFIFPPEKSNRDKFLELFGKV